MSFPKTDGVDTIYADELNYMYDPYDIKASMLENAVNVTKLNYCYSVTEIDHDYMVIDVMTDASGYNNSICTVDTTSTFTGTALTGHYSGQGTLVKTIIIEYTNPIQTSYLKLDKAGTGTIVYNVYNATTDALIGTALEPNTTHTLTSAVECHYYELIQCSDAVSCIKSYAIISGKV